MSERDVKVVRDYNEPYDGRDLAALIRERLDGIDLDDRTAVASAAARAILEEPITRHLHPDVVWDLSGAGDAIFGEQRGLAAVAQYWVDWAGVWESYVYRVSEYRDLGGTVLTVADTRAHSREGMDLRMDVFQVWTVRDGKIASMRAFLTEQDALDAEQRAR